MVPNLLTAVGDLAAVHQVNVTSDVSGRITDIMFTAGATVKAGSPLVQLFDGPDQGDLASFKAQAIIGAQLALDRAKQLAARQFGPQATVDAAQATFDQANAGIAKTEAIISQKLVRAPFDGVLGVRHVEVGQYPDRGHADRDADRPVDDLCELHDDRKGQRDAQGRADRACRWSMPIRARFSRARSPPSSRRSATDTRNIRVQATLDNPDHILKPGMFATTTVVLPDKPPVVTVPETAVDYTLYGDSVFLITEKKADDGKTSLTAVRTFVRDRQPDRRQGRNPQRREGRRSRGRGRPAQAAIGRGGVDLDRRRPPIPANPPRY